MWKAWALIQVHKQQQEHMQRRTAAVGLHQSGIHIPNSLFAVENAEKWMAAVTP